MATQTRKRQPRALFERAANVVVDRSLSRLLVARCQNQEDDDVRREMVAALLRGLPTSIANYLMCAYVNRFVRRQGRRRSESLDGETEVDAAGDSEVPSKAEVAEAVAVGDPLLLVDILTESLSAVDLSPLVRLGRREHADLLAFNARLLAALPRLGQLTRLVLNTHGKSFTLPVCSDRVLEEIAARCPRLVHLDVSHNTGVSAGGLTRLCAGCPLLEELLLFDCVLPTAVLAGVLLGLPRLRVLGHKELGSAVLHLHREARGPGLAALRLTHVTNLGETALHKSATEPHRLRCRQPLVRALRDLCPDLEELKVRALDQDVRHLGALSPTLGALELRFHAAAKPTSLGAHTLHYLAVHGARLTALTVYSHSLHAGHLALVGERCPHLRQLWMRTNLLLWDDDGRPAAHAAHGAMFTRLENLSLRVGSSERSVCRFPASLLQGVLRDAKCLRKLYVAVNSADVTDAWLAAVLGAFDASALRTLFVLLPNVNEVPFALHLTEASVELVRARCPDLEELGNLLVWSFQQEEVRFLQRQLRAANSVLRLVAKETVWR